ncbi:MAG TPA: cation transporter [Gemmatimonadaceae bacterium]|nr:cation transporter [Gemmatimonadaceae bacterium]
METLHLTIDGMSCGHCVARVSKALGAMEGLDVEAVRIGGAELRYDPERRSVDDILEAVRDAGYEPSVVA